MKKLTAVLATGLLLALAVGPAQAVILGSPHDFSVAVPNNGLCKTCHVPHKPLLNVPLWAHALSTQTYSLYNSNAEYVVLNAGLAYPASPTTLAGSKSSLCLSCHDGTVAVNGTTFISAANNIMWNNGAAAPKPTTGGTNDGLKGSHPIGVTYMTLANEFNAIPGADAVRLDSASKVQCTSCHNPHQPLGASSKMLVKSNTLSAICTTCHIK